MYVDVSPKPLVIGGAFSEVARYRAHDAGIDSWCTARVKDSRIKGVSVIQL